MYRLGLRSTLQIQTNLTSDAELPIKYTATGIHNWGDSNHPGESITCVRRGVPLTDKRWTYLWDPGQTIPPTKPNYKPNNLTAHRQSDPIE